jgi:hypothetical protein
MQRSKNLAVMFLLGAVLVGSVLGFTADRVMIRDEICPSRTDKHSMRERLADRLQLSQSQATKVDSLLDERHRQYQMVMATVRDQLDSVKLRSREQIRLILTDAQKKRFEELLAEVNDPNRSRDKDDNE